MTELILTSFPRPTISPAVRAVAAIKRVNPVPVMRQAETVKDGVLIAFHGFAQQLTSEEEIDYAAFINSRLREEVQIKHRTAAAAPAFTDVNKHLIT